MRNKQIAELIEEIVKAHKSRREYGSHLDADDILDLLEVKFTEFGIIDFYETPSVDFQWESEEGGSVVKKTHWDAHRLQAQDMGKIV